MENKFNKKNLLSIYFTAGYPKLNDTATIIKALDDNKVDVIEIGLPYSDPLADGETIQLSSAEALKNGINLNIIFNQLENILPHLSHAKPVLMGYFNQLLKYGLEQFLQKCHSLKIDTVIIPDLPFEIYVKNYLDVFEKHNVSPVFLITPQTSKKRLLEIDRLSNQFIYAVSANSITGNELKDNSSLIEYLKFLNTLNLKTPVLLGFGISNAAHFNLACKYLNGGIIGSAFIKALKDSKNISKTINQFINHIKSSS
ncbi:MAG: tryptophan synthase subunit alpha [Vicingaceae bacterium]